MSVTTSFFAQVGRYPAGDIDPRENRATAVLGAVCERVVGLARQFALAWTDPAPSSRAQGEREAPTDTVHQIIRDLPRDAPVRVRTQVATEGRFVDLELRFMTDGPRPRTAATLWVEVKHGTGPHTEQLTAYHDALGSRPGAVVLLAPRTTLPILDQIQCPAGIPQRSWQASGRIAQAFATSGSVEKWLIDELTSYLQEEGLMDLTALGPEHLTALAYGKKARESLAVVTGVAADHITENWRSANSEQEKSGRPAYGLGYYQAWEPPAGDWGGAYFDWNVAESAGAPVPDGTTFFMVGLSKDRRSGSDFADVTSAWYEQLRIGTHTAGEPMPFEFWQGRVLRLQRVGLPQDVLRGRTLEEQGVSLGRWVVETFQALERHGPPPALGL